MECPACSNTLSQMETGGVTVDICKGGCGGIWFDNYEFKKFDEPHESAGEALLDMEKDSAIAVDAETRRGCPRCSGITMARHFVSVKRNVEIDECRGCGGIWLDAGELGDIRGLFKTEEERIEAAGKYFTEVFSDDMLKVRQESQENVARARRFANMFKFITPSYYIPGKQTWGAF